MSGPNIKPLIAMMSGPELGSGIGVTSLGFCGGGIGSLITLAIVVLLTQAVLAFILRGFGDAAVWTAYFLASVVVSPLLFVGAALLYVDQAARAEVQ